MCVRTTLFSVLLVAGGAFGSAGAAIAQPAPPVQRDTGALNCTSGPFTDSGNANTTASGDFVTVDVDDLSVGTTVTFSVTTTDTNAAVNIDDDGGVDGDYDPNQILNNGGEYQSVFTAEEAGDIVFTLEKQNPPGTWLTWTATCGGGANEASMRVEKEAEVEGGGTVYDEVDDIVTYTVTVTNTGDVTLTDLEVTEASFTGNGTHPTFSCPAGPIAPDASVDCTATYAIVQGDLDDGDIDNVAQATVEEIDNPVESNEATVTASAAPSMKVEKTGVVDGGTVYDAVNDMVAYTVTVTNTGNVTLNGLSVTEVSFSGTGTPPTFSCPVDTIAPSSSVDCTGSYTIVQEDLNRGNVINVAQAEVAEIAEPVRSDEFTVNASTTPAMTVEKSAEVDSGTTYNEVGDAVSYTVKVTNTGGITLTNLAVSEASFNGNGTAPSLSCPADTTLAPAQFINCTASYTIVQGDLDDGEVTNVAQATAEEITDDPIQSNEATITALTTPTMTVVKSAMVNGSPGNKYLVVGDVINYTVRVTNIGGVTLTGLSVTEFSFSGNGSAPTLSCPDTTLDPDESVNCTANYTIVQDDLADGQVHNVAQAEVEQINGPVISNEVTVFYDDSLVEREVDEATRAFLFRRMDRLLSDGPDRARLLRKRADHGFAASPFDFAGFGGSGSGMNVAFSTSLQQVMAYSAASAAQKLQAKARTDTAYADLAMAQRLTSGGGGADLPLPVYEDIVPSTVSPPTSPFDLWIEGHYTNFDSDFGDGDFGVAYAGADYLINDRLLVGLLAQFDWMSQTEGDSSDVEGFGWMAGPYVSAEVVKNVFFDARFAWGQSDNDASVDVAGVPFSGDFDTDRWLAQAKLSGNYSRGNWRFTPEISVGYIEEKRKTFDVSDSGGATSTIDGTTLSLGRLTVGPEFAYRLFYGGLAIEPQLAIRLLWDFHAEGDEVAGVPVYDNDPRGAVELGLGLQSENGVTARVGLKYDGIGTDGSFDALNLNGQLNIPF